MVVAYLRVSTGRQHLANQRDEIRRFAESKKLIVDRWVTEIVSGKKSECDRKLGALLRKMNCQAMTLCWCRGRYALLLLIQRFLSKT